MSEETSGKIDFLVNENDERYLSQISLLERMASGSKGSNLRAWKVDELALALNKEEGDVLRSLYILEGPKFVSPVPENDLTSRIWCLTEKGMTALKRKGSVHVTNFL